MREGWEIRKVKDICDKASSNIAQKDIVGLSGEYPVFGASGYVQSIGFFHRDKPYIGIVKDGSGVGRVNVYPAKTSLLGTLQYILPKEGYLLGYVAYLLKSLKLAKFATGAAIPHIYFKEYGECKVPVPPIAEQEKIVAELDCLTGIIEKKKQQLEELDKLAQSIFYDMFGDPITNEKGWDTTKVIDVVSFQRGYDLPVQSRIPGRVPVYGSNGIISFHNASKVDKGIITGRSGTLGLVYSCDKPFWPLNTTLFSTDIHDNNLIYLRFLLSAYNLKRYGEGAGVPTLNRNAFHNEPIIKVSIDLQDEFAKKVKAIEKQKELVKRSIVETETLFNSRMGFWFN